MFTTSIEQTLTQIEHLHQQGSSYIARLAVGCLWLTSLREQDPRKAYRGPMGETPLPYLEALVTRLKNGDPGQRVTTSALTSLLFTLGPDSQRRHFHNKPSSQEINDRIATGIKEVADGGHPYTIIRILSQLWRDGIDADQLQPLIERVTEDAVLEEYRMDGGELLIELGLWERGLALLRSVPNHESIAHGWPGGAEVLVRHGHPHEARQLLDDLMARVDQLSEVRQRQARSYAAVAYAFMGDVQTARALGASMNLYNHLEIEGAIVLGAKARGEPVNTTPLLAVLEQQIQQDEAVAKSRAHTQTAILEMLLYAEAFEAALGLLDPLRETLLQIPTWGKREWRTADAALVLAPYAQDFTEPIFEFAANLMLHSATSEIEPDQSQGHGDFWTTCQIVCGVLPLIGAFAPPAELEWMLQAIKEWPNIPREQEAR